MDAYSAAQWHDFLIAVVGASAALVGLLFVAVSLNIDRILAFAALPLRAAATLVLLVNVVIQGSIVLVPGQTRVALGVQLAVVSVLVWAFLTTSGVRQERVRDEHRATWVAFHQVTIQLGSLPFVIGAFSILAGAGGGLYWVGAAVLLAFVVALSDAWVLLIEIRR